MGAAKPEIFSHVQTDQQQRTIRILKEVRGVIIFLLLIVFQRIEIEFPLSKPVFPEIHLQGAELNYNVRDEKVMMQLSFYFIDTNTRGKVYPAAILCNCIYKDQEVIIYY